jgi:STE24 endopeptidase
MSIIIFWIIIGVLVFDYVLERVLEIVNSSKRNAVVPKEVEGIYDDEEYKKQQAYEKAKSKFGLLSSSFSLLLILGMLLFDGFAFVDTYIYANFGTESEPLNHTIAALIFFGVLMFASDIIGIPFELYNTFVIEEKFGFNKMKPKTFIFDKLKGWLIGALIGGGLLWLLLFLIGKFESNFWIYAWVVVAGFLILFTMFYSSVIVPLFNKQTPLEDGELKSAIFEFSNKVGFKLDNIFVIDGSKRSTKANAYFSGLGSKKRIVLFDTLIQEMTTEEIVAVLAHEVGHYKRKHTLQMIFASVFQMGLLLYVFGLLLNEESLTQALEISHEPGKYHIALFVFSILYSPLSFVIGILMNVLSRKNEFEADEFAGKYYNAQKLIEGLRKLVKKNLSNLTPHKWYVFFYYSHPPVADRIKALLKVEKE